MKFTVQQVAPDGPPARWTLAEPEFRPSQEADGLLWIDGLRIAVPGTEPLTLYASLGVESRALTIVVQHLGRTVCSIAFAWGSTSYVGFRLTTGQLIECYLDPELPT